MNFKKCESIRQDLQWEAFAAKHLKRGEIMTEAGSDTFYRDIAQGQIELAYHAIREGDFQGAKKCSLDAARALSHLVPKDPTPPLDLVSDRTPTYSVWKHFKGGTYVVIGVGKCSTNGERDDKEVSIFYVSTETGNLRYREISEFLERFERVK